MLAIAKVAAVAAVGLQLLGLNITAVLYYIAYVLEWAFDNAPPFTRWAGDISLEIPPFGFDDWSFPPIPLSPGTWPFPGSSGVHPGDTVPPLDDKFYSRWQQSFDTDGEEIPGGTRRLRDSEITPEMHRDKTRHGRGMGPTDSYYVDRNGNLYLGKDQKSLENLHENLSEYTGGPR